MVKTCCGEIHRRMAVVAIRTGVDMSGVFARCPHSIMATSTLEGCTFENTAHVTSTTLDQIVRTRKWKSCEEMIEILCLLGGRQRRVQTDQQHEQTPDSTSGQ